MEKKHHTIVKCVTERLYEKSFWKQADSYNRVYYGEQLYFSALLMIACYPVDVDVWHWGQ